MAGCAVDGGCPTDYIAVTFSLICVILLVLRALLPCLIHKVPRPKGSNFWLPAVQVFASFNLLLSIVVSVNFLQFRKRHWWQSCYLWAVWVEGPLGFGLLLSCRIVQASQLYYIFVRRHLPPIRSYFFLPLILFPWVVGAALIHMNKPLNSRCHMRTQWIIPVVCLHALYVSALVAFTAAIRHIDFRFHELKDLWRGIIVSTSSIGIWVIAYILNEIHEDIQWLQVASRFLLLTMASVFMLAFFSLSSSQPLLSQMNLSRKEVEEFRTMGQALGIPESGLLSQRELAPDIDPSEPLDKLLLNKRFRQSFMAFADSCLAGESLHFYEEVHELNKIPDIYIYIERERGVMAGKSGTTPATYSPSPATQDKKKKKPPIFNDADWVRSDARGFHDCRPAFLRTGAVNAASGSAYAEFGKTKVIVSVFGPRESKKAMMYSDTGRLNCNVSYTYFSTPIRGQGSDNKEFTSILHKALEGAIILESFPKTTVDVFALVLESGGSDLPVVISCASLALADAGIMMYDLVTSVSVSCLGKNLVIDPTLEEENRYQDGSLMITCMPRRNEVTQLSITGEWSTPKIQEAMELCLNACSKLGEIMSSCLKEATSALQE